GFNGSAGSSFVGSTTPTISSALSNLPASLSSSNDFEIGSREVSSDHLKIPSKLRGSITGARIAADFRSSPTALSPTSACSKSRDVSPKFVRRPQDVLLVWARVSREQKPVW